MSVSSSEYWSVVGTDGVEVALNQYAWSVQSYGDLHGVFLRCEVRIRSTRTVLGSRSVRRWLGLVPSCCRCS